MKLFEAGFRLKTQQFYRNRAMRQAPSPMPESDAEECTALHTAASRGAASAHIVTPNRHVPVPAPRLSAYLSLWHSRKSSSGVAPLGPFEPLPDATGGPSAFHAAILPRCNRPRHLARVPCLTRCCLAARTQGCWRRLGRGPRASGKSPGSGGSTPQSCGLNPVISTREREVCVCE